MRLRLLTVLLLLILAASSWAAFGIAGGMFLLAIVLAVAAYVRFTVGRSWLAHLVVLGLLLLIAMSLLLPAGCGAREAARRASCFNNLKQISRALLNYDAEHGSFPPAVTYDKQGKPMHSWRVLILPYLDRRDLYDEYKFGEPWDGPNNRKLLAVHPAYYRCPSDKAAWDKGSTITSYVAVVGSRAAWRRDKGTSLKDIASHGLPENTILVIENADSGTPWTEPRDFSLDDVPTFAADKSKPIIRCSHMRDNGYFFQETPAGACVAFADGHVGFLPASSLTPDKLKNLLAIGGCREEDIERSLDSEHAPLNWPHCIGFPAWLLSVGALLFLAVRGRKKAKKRTAEDAEEGGGRTAVG
jgi:hypothetical protein